jgi:2-iminobutanoate/2-iminopropanoate deaminase
MKYLREIGEIKAKGSYSLAVSDGRYVYVSGQIAIDINTGQLIHGSARDEAKLILQNIEKILDEFGCDRNDVIKTTAFMTDMTYWSEINEEYDSFFTLNRPARSAVAIKDSGAFGFKVEIEAIAVVGNAEDINE